MNNTHALLLAFIEASGYEVEEVSCLELPSDQRTMIDCMPVIDYRVTKKVELINRYDDPTEYRATTIGNIYAAGTVNTRASWAGILGLDVANLEGFEVYNENL